MRMFVNAFDKGLVVKNMSFVEYQYCLVMLAITYNNSFENLRKFTSNNSISNGKFTL